MKTTITTRIEHAMLAILFVAALTLTAGTLALMVSAGGHAPRLARPVPTAHNATPPAPDTTADHAAAEA